MGSKRAEGAIIDSDISDSSSSIDSDDGAHPMDQYLAQRSGAQLAGPPQTAQQKNSDGKNRSGVAGKPGTRPSPPPKQPTRQARGDSEPESGELPTGSADDIEDFDEAVARGGPDSSASPSAALSDDGDSTADERHAKKARKPAPPAAPKPPPVGVTVLAEGEVVVRNVQVDRLLRQPRYFDEDYAEAGIRCFKCAGLGHMARDCTNAARERACFLCAGFGHDSKSCPNSMCWSCQRQGHLARDCPYGYSGVASWEGDAAGGDPAKPVCMRCGDSACPAAGQRDYIRAEGGCTRSYTKRDRQRVNCYVCGARGHLCCAEAPEEPLRPSCFNCGAGGHTAAECPRDKPHVIKSERSGGQQHHSGATQQYYSGGGRSDHGGYNTPSDYRQQPRSGQYSGSGGRYDYQHGYQQQQQQQQPARSRFSGYAAYTEIEQPTHRSSGHRGAEYWQDDSAYNNGAQYNNEARHGQEYGTTPSRNGHQRRR